jgi:hypothetical protein
LPGGLNSFQTRPEDVEHGNIRMEQLRLSEEFWSIARRTDDQIFAGQRAGRQREHCWMIISQQHARVLRRAGGGDKGSSVHDTFDRRFWKSPILSKLTVLG